MRVLGQGRKQGCWTLLGLTQWTRAWDLTSLLYKRKKKAEIKKGKMIAKEGFLEKEKSGGARGVFTG